MGKLQNNGSLVTGYVTGQALEARLREYLPRREYTPGGGGGGGMGDYYTKPEIDAMFLDKCGDGSKITSDDFVW